MHAYVLVLYRIAPIAKVVLSQILLDLRVQLLPYLHGIALVIKLGVSH